MNIFNKSFHPPQEFKTPKFTLFRTNLDFNESDYQAVMANKEILRIWSQSEWPTDNFTLEENREDLKLHIEDNLNHEAYGHMIYSTDLKTCYGSLYVSPLSSVSNNYEMTSEELKVLSTFTARIDYWVIAGQPELERDITKGIYQWLVQDWKIRPLFALRPQMDLRRQIYVEFGMHKKFDLKGKEATLELYSAGTNFF